MLGFKAMNEPGDLELRVDDLMVVFGEPQKEHYLAKEDTVLARQGLQLFFTGKYMNADNTWSRPVMTKLQCGDCHSVETDVDTLLFNSVEKRADHSRTNRKNRFVGSTMKGVVNRESWFNGTLYDGYDFLGFEARANLKHAVKFCAVKNGGANRVELTDLESDMLINYFKTLGLELSDLKMPDGYSALVAGAYGRGEPNKKMLSVVGLRYLHKLPHTKVEPIARKERKLGRTDDSQSGKYLFESTCSHCHGSGKIEEFSPDRMKKIKSDLSKDNYRSVYNILRGETGKNTSIGLQHHYSGEMLADAEIEQIVGYLISDSANK